MNKRLCPWWLGYFLASPLRGFFDVDPAQLLSPYVREGMVVLEPGPGMGFFTLELARLTGEAGRVIAVDVQAKMIAGLKRRLAKAGLLGRVDARLSSPHRMGLTDLSGKVDFTLAFAVVHEMPDAGAFFAEVAEASKTGAGIFFGEPSGHVTDAEFEAEVQAAIHAGFVVVNRPSLRRTHAALLKKN